MAALELGVVELMAMHTATRLTGLVEMIRGLANPKSEVLSEAGGTLATPTLSNV
jgi:hypothetical protein